MEDRNNCPGCGEPVEREQVVCLRCGTNVKTGLHVRTPDSQAEQEPPVYMRALMALSEVLPGLFKPKTLFAAVLVSLPALALWWAGFWLMSNVVRGEIAGGFVAGLGMLLYAQAAAFLVDGEATGLLSAMSEWTSGMWVSFLVLLFIPIALLGALAGAG